MFLSLRRKFGVLVVAACIFSQASALAERVTDTSVYEKAFAVAPLHLTVGAEYGSPVSVCIAAFNNKSGLSTGVGSSPPGPRRSCSGERDSYFNVGGKATGQTFQVTSSDFVGEPFEQGSIDETLWLFKAAPTAFLYSVKDAKSGKDTVEAFCVAVIYPDPDYSKSTAGPRLIAYSRDPKPGSIDKDTKIKCGGMKYALGHQLKTEKPLFIGDPKELSKLAEHTNLESPVKQIEAKNTATSKAHK